MGKFCTSCGAALNEETKFCAKCGANASPASEEVRTQPNGIAPNSETVLSKVGKRMKTEAKSRVNELIADSLIPAIRIGRKNFIAKESLIDYLCNGYKAQRVKIQLNNLKNNCHNSIDKLTSVSI